MPAPPLCIARAEITGLVLAGGQSRRWGGLDKAWAVLAGRPLVAHVSERLALQTATIRISANRDPQRYAALGHEVWADDWPDGRGPLAGIATALRRIDTPWLLVVPVDSPCVPLNLAERLCIAALRESRWIATVDDGERLQPAFLLIHRDLADPLVQAVERDTRRLGAWVQMQQPARVDARLAGWNHQLCGANDPSELDRLRTLMRDRERETDGRG